ncbi:MAG: excinuclease ABC subunit UvrB [Desulfobacterales bacterium]|jgi:excinuclease ABC subunit B|nr:excinuclease ABC subunit UvrB [Desulfobacterales bacterium]
MPLFELTSPFTPKGDQPAAIAELSRSILSGEAHRVLLGVTGSGKTFTMAHVIASVEKPALVIAPNKTLAAQLYNEFRSLFPFNAVEYFVSYYDYYQPEAYIPASDTYIQKDSSINEMIDKLRHSATRSVLSRQDVIVVASVSCIYGLGAPEDYLGMRINLKTDGELSREKLLRGLVDMQYERNDVDFHRGTFRVRGDRVEIFPAYEEDKALRIEFFGDQIDCLAEIDPLRGIVVNRMAKATIFPASHFVTDKATLRRAIDTIKAELKDRVAYFVSQKKFVEAQRIEERTNFDLEMMLELGYCNGIENYSRHLTGRKQGEPPPTLLEYFPDDFIVFLDESHITVPQLGAMYKGDRSRKSTLAEYGFRLPSALDNRPLMFEEFQARVSQTIYVSATPATYELSRSAHPPVELIVRPTGLLDPLIDVRQATHQVDDLYEEILRCTRNRARALVTTLTKRMAEDLTEYYADLGVRVRYLHADVTTLERMEIIRDLRIGVFDVLVGINLLREGLDIPEVSLVAILDADKEGFLRSARSLVQTFGRAARNVEGRVIMYADRMTNAMKQAMEETERRRKTQMVYNLRHGITPATITKPLGTALDIFYKAEPIEKTGVSESISPYDSKESIEETILGLEKEMHAAARDLNFEQAAVLRDRIHELKKLMVFEL